MSSPTTISPDKLARLIGTANMPALIDVRTDEDFAADPRLIPGAVRRSHEDAADWGEEFSGRSAIVICLRGAEAGAGHGGLAAASPTSKPKRSKAASRAGRRPSCRWCRRAKLPPRDAQGRTVWVTRARPKIDRIACPWLIRRFVDPDAVFLFVAPSEVVAVGERFGAAAFDIENVFWSHRGELCTFDVMVEEFGLATPAMLRLATMVRAADTGAARSLPRRRPACSRHRSACRGCMMTISSSSRPASRSTTRSTAGAAMRPARPITGPPTRRSRDGCRCQRDAIPKLMPATASASARLSGSGCGWRC